MNTNKEDLVNHPSHYVSQSADGHEPIELCELYPFALGNAIKYLIRAGHKASAPEEQDLRKAKWYIERAVGSLLLSPVRGLGRKNRAVVSAFRQSNRYLMALLPGDVVALTPIGVGLCIAMIDARLKEIENER